MSSLKRIYHVIYGILALISAGLLLLYPRDGAMFVMVFIDVALLVYGIRMLVYYITLARFMVGGIMTLYKSIIVIDFGLFVFGLYEFPYRFIMLYLVAIMAFNGAREILSAMETRRLENPAWKRKIAYGAVTLVLALSALFVHDSMPIVTILYSIGLIHGGLYSIATAFRKSAIIYIG